MPSQKWRKKSEHSRKNATFADYFERVYPTLSLDHFVPRDDANRVNN